MRRTLARAADAASPSMSPASSRGPSRRLFPPTPRQSLRERRSFSCRPVRLPLRKPIRHRGRITRVDIALAILDKGFRFTLRRPAPRTRKAYWALERYVRVRWRTTHGATPSPRTVVNSPNSACVPYRRRRRGRNAIIENAEVGYYASAPQRLQLYYVPHPCWLGWGQRAAAVNETSLRTFTIRRSIHIIAKVLPRWFGAGGLMCSSGGCALEVRHGLNRAARAPSSRLARRRRLRIICRRAGATSAMAVPGRPGGSPGSR